MRIVVTWTGMPLPRRGWEKQSERYLARRGHQTELIAPGQEASFEPNIVLATDPNTAPLAEAIASRYGVPFVVQENGAIPPESVQTDWHWSWKQIRESLDKASMIVAVSESAKRHFLATYTPKCPMVVCYQGVDDELASKYLNQPKAEDFIWIGPLEQRKRPRIALDAVCEAKVKLAVIGHDQDNVADDYIPLGEDIQFLGIVSDEEKFKQLSISRCLLVASEGEEFFIPAAEAGFYGLALIFPTWSDRHDHWIEVFRELYGDLPYYYSSRYELPGVLKFVKENPGDAAKRGEAIRRVVMEKGLTMTAWAERMEGLLSSVAEGEPEPPELEIVVVWADMESLCRMDFCEITYNLRRIEETYEPARSKKVFSTFHWSRRFEYPWTILTAHLGSDDVVLDAGGGRALFQFLAAPLCKEYHNFDIDESTLGAAERLAREQGHDNMVFTKGDLTERLPYPDGHFDKVLCISTLEHIPHPMPQMVDELVRVLKPGGLFLLTIDVSMMKVPEFNITLEEARELCSHLNVPWTPPPPTALVSTMTANGISQSPKVMGEGNELFAIPLRVMCFKIEKKAGKEEPAEELQLYQQYLRGMIKEGRQARR